MPNFAYKLGDVVYIDPAGGAGGPQGKVVGLVEYIDGSLGYVVSAMNFSTGVVQRHSLTEWEIHPVDE